MGKKSKELGLETFLKSDFLKLTQSQTLSGYEVVKKYPLNPPFSYAIILRDKKTSGYLYQVDEVKLNPEEEELKNTLYNLIELNLDSPKENKAAGFESYLNIILKNNQKIFTGVPIVSLEKVKYFIHRDIASFGKIDALMHDPNIEDISCSGVDLPVYVWHREFDSVRTNIKFEGEQLNNFITRIVFRAGKHISSAFPISDLAL